MSKVFEENGRFSIYFDIAFDILKSLEANNMVVKYRSMVIKPYTDILKLNLNNPNKYQLHSEWLLL